MSPEVPGKAAYLVASDHPVIDLLRQRRREGSLPADRGDGAKLGLVIEGGAMRGVVSAGMLAALEKLGFQGAFDAVYGSSAGAINGAYFAAKQVSDSIGIYYEDINNRRFISLARSFTRRPVMSLSYLLDEVMVRHKVLDWQAVLDSSVQLKILASSLRDLRVRLFDSFSSRAHLFAALRASSSIPLLAGPPAEVDGERFLDALLFEPIPYRTALADGCTHVLVLLTRPNGSLNGEPTFFERHVIARWIASLEPRLRQPYLAQERGYDDDVQQLSVATRGPEMAPFLYAMHLPSTAQPIRWLERDPLLLIAAAEAGGQVVAETLLRVA